MPISSAFAVGSGTPAPELSASRMVAKTAAGSHTLTIDGYSHIKEGYNRRKSVMSAKFTVGGHTWYTEFIHHTVGVLAHLVSMCLRLRCTCAHCINGKEGVSAAYTFSLLDHNGQPCCTMPGEGGDVFEFTRITSSGVRFLESRMATYLRGGDRLRVRCDLTVYMAPRCEDSDVPSRLVDVPPPDMGEQLGRLLASGVGADLTFEVAGGETFAVHRHILNVRSPVLLDDIISAADGVMMEAEVVKALLHYIYTDSVPKMDEGKTTDMARHLIAAADTYSLDRLKLICEGMLCCHVDTSTVAATLALAEEYNCHGLKKACVQFLMSGSNLKDALAAGGFEHLRSTFPSVLKDLLALVERR